MRNRKQRNVQKTDSKTDQGFSLFTVIVAVSFVGILGMLILYMALANFQMKVTDLKGKDSFYMAERALEEVRVGLQEDVGEAMSSAYIKVLETYSKNSDNSELEDYATLDEIRQAEFKELFVEELAELLSQPKNPNSSTAPVKPQWYSLERLNSYLDILNEINEEEESLFITNPADKEPLMVKDLSGGILLKNLKSIYVDPLGKAAVIETDIRLGIPKVEFPTPSTLPDLMNMIVVANGGIVCEGKQATEETKISGSIYAGNTKTSIQINPGASLRVSDGNNLVCQGDIDIQNGGKFINENVGSLWARGISVASGEVKLTGKTCLADDLTVKTGNGSNVTISGEYYGYGSPSSAKSDKCKFFGSLYTKDSTNTELSSAITVNGRNTTMDLSGVSKLMLAGKNYIADSNITFENKTNSNIVMGESLTVKGTQLAYLVPAELIGNGKQSNPMKFEDYPKDGAPEIKMDVPVEAWGGKTLREVGVDPKQPVQEIYYNDNSTDGYVYFYLNFKQDGDSNDTNNEKAAAFMQMYYTNNPQVKKNMDKYLSFYVGEDSGIKVNSSQSYLRYITHGNVLTYDGSQKSGSLNSATNPSDSSMLNEELIQYQNTWFSLNRKMIGSTDLLKPNVPHEDGSSHNEADANRTVFDNLVNEEEMVEFLKNHNNKYLFTMPDGEEFQALLENNGEENGGTNTCLTIKANDAQKLRLIVCTGDVKIQDGVEFHGIIMTKGELTLGSGAKVISSPMEAAKVFQSQTATDGISPKKFFWDGNKYVLGNAIMDNDGTSGTQISDVYDLAECVTYENWKKK